MLSDSTHIIDTGVLKYFLLVKEEELLGTLIGWPLRVPLAVYDPEERMIPVDAHPRSELLSEMRQAIKYYDRRARSNHDTESLWRVSGVDRLYDQGRLVAEVMSNEEQRLAFKLEGANPSQFGLRASLGPGETACVAIAYERGWTIVTDDSGALTVLDALLGKNTYKYERIRKLLIRAADENLITRERANSIHTEITARGFWDKGSPFPEEPIGGRG